MSNTATNIIGALLPLLRLRNLLLLPLIINTIFIIYFNNYVESYRAQIFVDEITTLNKNKVA